MPLLHSWKTIFWMNSRLKSCTVLPSRSFVLLATVWERFLRALQHFHSWLHSILQVSCVLFCSFNAADCHLHVDTLAGNAFSVLPQALQACSMLANLQMRGNQLEELPAWISGMANLRTLNVIANQLQALPFELADLRRLQDLKYEDNDLNFPPPTVLEGGLDAIKVYLGRLRSAPATGVVDLVRAPMTAFSCPNYLASYPITQLILNFNGLRELRVDLARLSSLKVAHRVGSDDICHDVVLDLTSARGPRK